MLKPIFTIIVCIILCFQGLVFSQPVQGLVTYERKQYWTKIQASLTYISEEEKEKDKYMYGSMDERKDKMKLYFDENRSMYGYLSDQGQTDDGRYTWRLPDLFYLHDYTEKKRDDIIETMGQTYIIQDELPDIQWKILNQIKDISGHVCMMAETYDSIKSQKVIAWFAGDIPVQAGPENYYGLPGLILELDINDGALIITATNVEMKAVADGFKMPKIKGKKLTNMAFLDLVKNHIAKNIKGKRNPYWSLRY